MFAFFLALSEVNYFFVLCNFVRKKEERSTLHQLQRKLAITMMYNTYGIEDDTESEDTCVRQSKRNREDKITQHTLLAVPSHAKC